jgi:hypothetical protein
MTSLKQDHQNDSESADRNQRMRPAILREPSGKFGAAGPSKSRELHQDQLDNRSYDCKEAVEFPSNRPFMNNPSGFK